jgi:hypothetical protein
MIYLPGINIFERISALVNVTTFSIAPFILTATVFFIKALVNGPSILMLYLSILMIIPGIYSLLVPIIIKPLTFRGILYYYICLLIYLTLGLPVNLVTYSYALLHMDIIKWGKTRALESIIVKEDDTVSENTTSTKSTVFERDIFYSQETDV